VTGWTSTDQVNIFAEHVLSLLSTDPVGNTIALTVLDWLLSGRSYSDATPHFAWYDNDFGETTGAVLITPPYELLLAALPAASVEPLVTHLRQLTVAVPGVRGSEEVAATFVASWTKGTELAALTGDHLRLYGLSTLTPPDPAPPGGARLATEADTPLVTSWWEAYQQEAEAHLVEVGPLATHAIADGLLWLWVDDSGTPVAMAGRKSPVGGASRIGPVFTPPEHRSRGYGGAVTTACASAALSSGAEHVLLFTDLSNPISNLIYQRIGFTPISDAVTVRFQGRD
jgi:ribosomal protein S18 acetylase RimI-like enzyme